MQTETGLKGRFYAPKTFVIDSSVVETDLYHYQRLRDLFARRDFEAVLLDPFGRKFPPIQSLRTWAAFLEQKSVSPPDLTLSHQPLSVQCQQALLWAALAQETGEERFQQAANRLAGMVFPLIEHRLTTVWALESEYLREETLWSVELFRQALGDSARGFVPDGFFSELQAMKLKLTPEKPVTLPYTLFVEHEDAMVYTFEKSMGAARVGTTNILAFGLQKDPHSFGIQAHGEYVCPTSMPDVWVHVERKAFGFSLRAVGLNLETPLHLAFYLDAKNAFLNEKKFKPRTLNKFQGTAEKFCFDDISLTTTQPLSTELVPLANDHSFWGASFLLSLKIPLSGEINLQIAK